MTALPATGTVLVVGGGIAGMALAIALKRAGIGCEVVEINPQWTVAGLGIGLGGPALRALKMIGLIDQCVARGFGYSHFNAADAQGNIIGTVQMPRLNGPDYPATIGIMRHHLHIVLQQGMADAGVPIRLGVTVATPMQDEDAVGVTFTDGSLRRYGLVVGADGANSKIRDLLFGTTWRPKYTGQAVWRATVSRPAEVQSRTSYHGPRHKAGYNPMSDRHMYLYLVQNLPKFVRLADAQLPGMLRELLSDFGGLIGAARDEIDDPETIAYRPITSLILPPPWYRGRVILIGDAAHTITPHMAAGAGIAIEDSIVLAQVLQTESSVSAALEAFMRRRFERCRLVVDNSLQLGEWEKAPNMPGADPVGIEGETVRALAQPF
jgi:2-polyprenyl-6-methoxyphenol hydroxylase-like FAD-dependent oxidoreductase